MRDAHIAAGFIATIERCGDVLATHAPPDGSSNELADRLSPQRTFAELRQSAYNEPADSVLQSETLPELNPFKNQRLRCADVPWVKASGTT